jgi:hypothetical protein
MTKTQRDWLIENKLDPEVYDVDAEGNVFENPIMGKTEAGLRSAAASTVPSLAAIPAAMAAGEGGALLGAPLGPVGSLVVGGLSALAGGAAAAYAANKGQEALLEKYSPETLQKLSQAQEEQPVASYIGGFAPTALTARPSLKGLSELGRPLVRQTTLREAITKPTFVEPAMNVAANVAQSTGQQIAEVTQGGEFSGGQLAADIALGTLFNRPTRLGRKLGMAEGPQEGPVQKLDLEEARTRVGQQIDAERVAAEPAQIETAQPKEEGDWWKSSAEPSADFINEKAARFKVDEFGNTIDALAKDPNANDVAQTPEQVPNFIQNKYGESLQSTYESISKINETSDKLIRGLAEEQMGEIQRSLARKKESETLGFRDILPKANDAAQDIYDTVSGRLQRQGEGAKITQADIDAAAQIAARRNLTIELDRPFAGSTEVRGMYLSDPNTGNRIVRVNPLMATADTAIHEIGHDVFQGVTNPSMRKSLLESAQDTPAYKSELLARAPEVQEGKITPKQAQEFALEEGLIQAFGEQIPNIKRSDIRSWFYAFKASTKQLLTGKVSPEDAIAWMHYATTESVPWKGVTAPKATEQRFQREEQKTRAFAGRVAEAEQLPTEVRETVGQSPEAQYTQQNVGEVVDRASSMSLSQLNADLADTSSNTRVASGMEIFGRQIRSGDMAGASSTALALAKSGTSWGQLINQFKLLNSSTPEGLVLLVQNSLANRNRKPMTAEQSKILLDAGNKLKLANDEVLAAGRVARDAFAANDLNTINKSLKQLDLADAKRSEVDAILNEQLAKINPADAADLFISMVQGSVMGPISIIRNVVGNAINYPLREIGDVGAAAIDATFSKDKNNSFNIRARTVDRINAIYKSLPAAMKTVLKGSNAMPYEPGTDIGNPLNFQRAWRRIAEDMAAGKIGSALSPRNLTEATIGILPDIMLRLTQATDIPFRQAERARIIGEIGRAKGLSEGQIQIAVRDPKLAFVTDAEAQRGRRGFTEDDLATIETESLKAIFQQDNKATKAVAGINRFIKNEIGSSAYIPYRLISLFQKTPINVAAEALQFTPAGALINDWGKMTARERNIAASRIAVGAMVTTAFGYLYSKGIISANLDSAGETNKARELAKSGGVMPPGTINLSALTRLVNGKDPKFQGGDTVVDLSSLGTAGALGIIAGTSLRQLERGRTNEDVATSLFKAVPTSGLSFVMEQQFLKGTSDFIKLLSQESTNSMDRWLKSLAVTAASPVAPAILGAVRRAERDKLPVSGGQSFIKDTVDELNQRYAALGLAIPGAKDPNAMPVRRDLWGAAVEQTPKGSNPWVYQFFNAWKARDIDADPLNTSIYTIWRRTADNSAIPSVPSPSLTWKQKTYDRMSPEQYDRYTELVGNYRRLRAEQEFMKPRFQQGGDERKLKLLQRAYDDGLLIAKKQFVRELIQSGQTLTPLAARRGFQQPSE